MSKFDDIKNWKPQDWLTPAYFKRLRQLLREGKWDEAIRFKLMHYPREMAEFVENNTRRLIEEAWKGNLVKQADLNDATMALNILITRGQNGIINPVRRVTTEVIAEHVFKLNRLNKKSLQNAVLRATVDQFESYVKGAMSGTQPHILAMIRNCQKEWILRNQGLRFREGRDVANTLYAAEAEFKEMLLKKYPELRKAMEKGQILRSRPYGPNLNEYKHFTLSDYTDMSVRATVLNVDRNAAEVAANFHGDRVVGYHLRDHRPIKTDEREICEDILRKKIKGHSLLALDDEAATLLGIYTVQDAKRKGAMFIHCRHSIYRLNKADLGEIHKLLYIKSLEVKDDEEVA